MDLDKLADQLARAAVRLAEQRHAVPVATYRLQMNAQCTFGDATRLVPYLAALGISHLYLSPVLSARPGSSHGYDVIDPSQLNPELGTEADFIALAETAQRHGMRLLLDVVPNHMFLGSANPWWRDIFEHGPSSPYASYFDIAWDDPPRQEMRGRLLLPLLGSPYWKVLQAGELQLACANGQLVLRYFNHELPIDPRSYGRVLRPMLERLTAQGEETAPAALELQSILNAVKHLPERRETDPGRIREGRLETEVIKRRLATLVDAHPAAKACLEEAVAGFAGVPDVPGSFRHLEELLDEQAYHLCFWRVASDEVNYRRFFDVNELAALSIEREPVFVATHEYLLRLCGRGLVHGLRVDHPDGLYDPEEYLRRLQWYYLLACAQHLLASDPAFAGVSWDDVAGPLQRQLRQHLPAQPPLYVVVEKILGRNEQLPRSWPTAGTTGYEFLNAINGLFVDPAGQRPLTELHAQFTDRGDSFGELVYRQKWLVLQSAFSSELEMLARQLDRLARQNRQARDFTLNNLRRALRAVIASFPVYRSYIGDQVSPLDEAVIRQAVRRARTHNATMSPDLFDFLRNTLLLQSPVAPVPETYAAEQRAFVGKFQQVTGPVTAKGLEDTAFYVYTRLLSLNEVGGDAGRFGWSVAEVHRFLADRQTRQPGSLSAGATHDTKRGEDVRARLNVLSELSKQWADRVHAWGELNRPHRIELEDGLIAPDPSEELLLYQTLVGAWPDDAAPQVERDGFPNRLRAYLWKAINEAKLHTSWINPNTKYEEAVQEFLSRLLDEQRSGPFLADLHAFRRRVARCGAINSLAQTLIRCVAPGVPDVYQGTELWDLSMVDPDNRRPVDFASRARILGELDEAMAPEVLLRLLAPESDGRAKMYVLSRSLRLRRDHAELFARGDYLPVEATGHRAAHLFAFVRTLPGQAVLAVAPRLVVPLLGEALQPRLGPEVWGDTRLIVPDACRTMRWRNHLTGELLAGGANLDAAAVLAHFPVALLVGEW